MSKNPSYKQAEWIHKNMSDEFKETADDVLDVLYGSITTPADFVAEVKYWAEEYENDFNKRSKHAI